MIALVSLKSFGDFIIARWALRQGKGLAPASSNRLLMGEHLAELDKVLGSHAGTLCLRHGEGGVPALFDMKKRGVWRGLHSAFHLRRQIGRADLPPQAFLVFDRIGFREHFIAGGMAVQALPVARNIYLAYLELLGAPLTLAAPPPLPTSPHIGIFPSSRIAAKNIPGQLVLRLAERARLLGARVEVFVLEGEPLDQPPERLGATIVPRRFQAMADAVRSVDAVISADSMPAHMAEYFGLPVFVVSPVANPYWLPLSCLETHRWQLFQEAGERNEQLSRFLMPAERTVR